MALSVSEIPPIEPIDCPPLSFNHDPAFSDLNISDYALHKSASATDSQLRDPEDDEYNPSLTKAADAVAMSYPLEFLAIGMDSNPHEQEAHEYAHTCDPAACDSVHLQAVRSRPCGHTRLPPSELVVCVALTDLELLLKPPRHSGRGYQHTVLDTWAWERLDEVHVLLNHYTLAASPTQGQWTEAAQLTVQGRGKGGRSHIDLLCSCARAFIHDRTNIPFNPFGKWNHSQLKDCKELRDEIETHLASIGRYIHAVHLYEYLKHPDVQQRYSMTGGISLATAKRWLFDDLDFRWSPTGYLSMYEDGHERPDVVAYRRIFVHDFFQTIEPYMRIYDNDGNLVPRDLGGAPYTSVWLYDQLTFYGYDRHRGQWVRKNTNMGHTLDPKGDGPSLMVANFVSANYGWLQSPDGAETACVFFEAGANRMGYYNNDHVLSQTHRAIDILYKHYPQDRHIFFFDNATTHHKRADDALSARHMPKYPSSNFFINKIVRDPITNKRIGMTKGRMSNGILPTGGVQELYFPDGHPEYPGFFKGMAELLRERGYKDTDSIRAQCPRFECDPTMVNCCCRRILYMQPDFVRVKSLLKEECAARGVPVYFIPKFHPEVTFIEQCWGAAKRTFREKPITSKESKLTEFVTEALDSVNILQMRRYVVFFLQSRAQAHLLL